MMQRVLAKLGFQLSGKIINELDLRCSSLGLLHCNEVTRFDWIELNVVGYESHVPGQGKPGWEMGKKRVVCIP